MNGAKIVFWDLECSSLNANFGFLLCGGYKFYGDQEAKVSSIADFPRYKRDPTNDKDLAREIRNRVSEADIQVTWFGCGFDIPFLNSRLLYHGLDPLPPIPHVDGWWIAKKKLRLNSNRLASVSAFLELDEKTPVTGTDWVKAQAGNKRSLKYVIDHCAQDVWVLEQAYARLLPLMGGMHPNVAVVDDVDDSCPVCGQRGRLIKRGWQIAKVSRSRRYQCKACGAWSKGRPERRKNVEVR